MINIFRCLINTILHKSVSTICFCPFLSGSFGFKIRSRYVSPDRDTSHTLITILRQCVDEMTNWPILEQSGKFRLYWNAAFKTRRQQSWQISYNDNKIYSLISGKRYISYTVAVLAQSYLKTLFSQFGVEELGSHLWDEPAARLWARTDQLTPEPEGWRQLEQQVNDVQ